MAKKFERQVAKYLFTKEVAETKVSFTVENDDSQYASVHAVTPTGQDVGRVFMCGTLTQTEDVGDNEPYLKGRLVDPTGAISIYAGQYQPEAARALEELETPAHITVVGKINLYTTEDGTVISSIRAESVSEVIEDTVRTWTFMAARNLIEHIENKDESKPKQMAQEAYGDVTTKYKEMAVNALTSVLPNEVHD